MFKYFFFFFILGGSNSNTELASVEVYDPEVGKWTYGPSLPVALSNIGKLILDIVGPECAREL